MLFCTGMKMRKIYHFTFVLPAFSLVPAGGYMVVFELSKYLVDNEYKVLVIFLRRMDRNLYKFLKKKEIIDRMKSNTLKFKLYDYFQTTLLVQLLIGIIKKFPSFLGLIGIRTRGDQTKDGSHNFFLSEFNFSGIDFLVRDNIPKKLQTHRIVATAWETAYFVDRFVGCNLKYYLAQHDEDDPSFSGKLSNIARKSYDLNLKKIVINKHMQERFSKENPIKITVASHVNGKIITKPEERNNKVIVMQLRASADKGAKYAIEAAQTIKAEHPDINIISFGDYKKKVPEFINHLGYVNNTRYIEILNFASIFILPSLVEGFSTPVLEAMSCGCVPVATKCGGPEDFVEHQKNGLLVPIKSALSIVENVLWLLNNNEKRIEMAYNAINTANGFSIDRMGSEFVSGVKCFEENHRL